MTCVPSRLLQISSFNGKMNALNEVNKVISSVSYYTHRHGNPEEEEWLTAERMAVGIFATGRFAFCLQLFVCLLVSAVSLLGRHFQVM